MITPRTPPKRSRYRGLLWKILIFDILMRLTPPLTFIALSVTGVALYKSAPPETKSKAKATSTVSEQSYPTGYDQKM